MRQCLWQQFVEERTGRFDLLSVGLRFAFEVGHDVGMGRRDVPSLARVLGEIEQERWLVFLPGFALAYAPLVMKCAL